MVGEDRTTKLCIYPEPHALAGEKEIYHDLKLPISGSPPLPYVVVNMVSSVDGRSSVGGKASGIGSRADREAMRALRSHVDAVMVGAGTLRAEKLNLGLDDPDARQPLAVIVGGSRDLPLGERLANAHQEVILAVLEGTRGAVDTRFERLTVVETPSTRQGLVDLRWLLEYLRTEHTVDRLLVEGGPALNRSMIDGGLADEIFLTLAPKILSGEEAAILRGGNAEATSTSRSLELLSVHSSGSELFLRYRLRSPR
jgi:riboflavin-specific deaminase-like protein